MREMTPRLNSKKYILAGILFGTCIYLYGFKFTARHMREKASESIPPFDTVTINPYHQVCYQKLKRVEFSKKKKTFLLL